MSIVDPIIEDPRWDAAELPALAERAAAAVLAHLGLDTGGFEIALLACDDARIATLNADFRGKPQPTNVLSWPSEERGAEADGSAPLPPDDGDDPELGDIAIAFDTCAREAAERGLPLADHATHLIVHGTLHLLGYDHQRDLDATLMEGLETAILGKLGLADPYREA
ncbi:MAG: rRNA maturation RNase YbeY [Paracoccaceae bacterium]